MENKTNIVANSGLADLLDMPVNELKINGVPKTGCAIELSAYERAKLDSKIESDEEGERIFHNQGKAYSPLCEEKPHHRVMLFLLAEGNTAAEVAEKTGFSISTVTNLQRQPWAARRIDQIISESGRSKVELVLKGAAMDAVNRLVAEMDNLEARPSERITAADKLLDRVYGKPNQPLSVKSEGKSLDQMSDAEIAAELEKIRSNRN